MRRIFATVLLASIFLYSCDKNEETTSKEEELSPAEASAMMSESADQMADDILTLAESEGVEGLMDLIGLLELDDISVGRADQDNWARQKLALLKHYFLDGPVARVSDDDFYLEDIAGLYEWNSETEEFDVTASEIFAILFPTEGSDVNNAEFQISELVIEDELPVVITSALLIDDTEVIKLSYEVEWTFDEVPVEAEVSLFVTPFTFSVSYNSTFDVNTSLITSVSLDDEVITSIDVDAEFEDDAKEELVALEGSIQYRDLSLEGEIDLRDLQEDADPNDYINLELYNEDFKIGDIVFEMEEDDYVAYVVYADGSKENLEDILLSIEEELEELLEDFE